MGAEPDAVRRAIREIRREGYKAAFVHGVVDAAVVLLAVNLLVARVIDVPLPPAGPVDAATLIGVAAGAVTFVVEFGLRTRRYTVERFESANPAVADALRTARDAATAEQTSPMADRLYADVLARLERTSSAAFVDSRWLAVGVVVLLALSGATVHSAAVGLDLSLEDADPLAAGGQSSDPAIPDGTNATDGGGTNGGSSLRSGEPMLGDPRNVSAGSEELLANVSTGVGSGDGDADRAYENSGLSADEPSVAARRAGYDAERSIDDAALVREYTLRLQARDSDDD